MPDQRRRFSRTVALSKVLLLGLSTAVIGLLSYFLPFGLDWEENIGLETLYTLRGHRVPPADVVLVSIDKGSADRLGLINNPAQWPREMHAQIIDQLAEAGATVVAFDVFFKEPRDPKTDQLLVDATRRAGNVLLFAYLKREIRDNSSSDIYVEQLVPPFPALAEAASGVAPFVLPKVPIRVSQFWSFHTSAGDVATLPVVALERYTAPAVRQWLRQLASDDAALMQQLLEKKIVNEDATGFNPGAREILLTHPVLLRKIKQNISRSVLSGDANKKQVEALLTTYTGGNRPYLNLYGPPHTIPTIEYADVLRGDAETLAQFKGKVVFVGFAENRQPEQKDGFFTVYSQPNGVDVSGVEIAATTFANILEGTTLQPLSATAFMLSIVAYGFFIAGVGRLPSSLLIVIGSGTIAGLYLMTASILFNVANIWLPWVVPLFIQTPIALVVSLLCRYGDVHRSQQQIHQAFSHYVPRNVADHFADNATPITATGQLMYGICLATDAERYTHLAEKLAPHVLSDLMNAYYEVLFAPVRAHHGIVSDVIGDAMLALWSSPQPEPQLRQQACEAALDIAAAAVKFSQQQNRVLHTRIGLHAGEMMIGNIGALDHYEYRAVGDIVNTASRIQGLNKQLGTNVIASEEVLQNVTGIVTRKLGRFILVGKEQAVTLYELLGYTGQHSMAAQVLCADFELAQALFFSQAWNESLIMFQRLTMRYPEDGPSAFYLKLCQRYVQTPPVAWRGAVEMSLK